MIKHTHFISTGTSDVATRFKKYVIIEELPDRFVAKNDIGRIGHWTKTGNTETEKDVMSVGFNDDLKENIKLVI